MSGLVPERIQVMGSGYEWSGTRTYPGQLKNVKHNIDHTFTDKKCTIPGACFICMYITALNLEPCIRETVRP